MTKVWNPHVDQSASGVPLHVRTHRIRISLHKRTSCLMLVSDTQTLLLKSRCFFNSPLFFGRCERVWALSSRFVSNLSIRGQRSGQRVGIRELHAVVTPGSTFDQTGWGEWSPPLNSRRSSIWCAISYTELYRIPLVQNISVWYVPDWTLNAATVSSTTWLVRMENGRSLIVELHTCVQINSPCSLLFKASIFSLNPSNRPSIPFLNSSPCSPCSRNS